MKTSIRSGAALVDLLVAIFIGLIMPLILAPAVQQVRLAAQRTQTANNLRQCSIAVHNYHGVYNKFPNAAWTGGIYTGMDAQRSMWFHLLPYVEQDNVYKNNVHDAVVDAYLSPDDKYLKAKEGKLNFAGNIRIFGYLTLTAAEANNAVEQTKGNPSGKNLSAKLAAKMQSGLTLARIPDGTSNTFMLATRYAECGSPAVSTYYSGGPSGTMLTGGGPVKSVGVPAKGGKGGFFGAGSHNKAPGDAVDAMFQLAPTVEKCLANDSVFGHSYGRNGLMVALCDASIKNVDAKMSPTTFCRALCPGDGFALDNDWGD
jgi:hypothetical protein